MSKEVKVLTKCRVCGSRNLYKFLDLGEMPIPNGFLSAEDLKRPEKKYELACFLCEDCGFVQLTNVVNPQIMFSNYLYVTAMANVMLNNFKHLSYEAHKLLNLDKSSLVIDIGSNDGSLLTYFKRFGTKVLGIDPAKNLAELARKKDIPTEVKLFNLKTAEYVSRVYGKAKVITATNVVAHIDNLSELLRGVTHLLTKDGVFISEFPYHLDLMHKNEFDTIYHEHLSYISVKPWKQFVENFGLEIIEVRRLPIHGGSVRITHRKKQAKNTRHDKNVDYLINLETEAGLYNKETYDIFANRVFLLKETLLKTLKDLKKQKKRIVGLGAAAKGNVLTNFFGIGPDILDFIADSTPYKQGLYTPGMHIPIFPEDKISTYKPDYVLILAWNFADEIIKKQRAFQKRGGKFIIPIPKVRII